jgi:hypothetical protein
MIESKGVIKPPDPKSHEHNQQGLVEEFGFAVQRQQLQMQN